MGDRISANPARSRVGRRADGRRKPHDFADSDIVDAILVEVAEPDERDRVSSQGWAFGYLGGGLLLAVNLAIVTIKPFGLSTEMAVRVSLLSAAIWWAYFTFIPYRGIKDRPPRGVAPEEGVTLMQRSFGQLFRTLKDTPADPDAPCEAVAGARAGVATGVPGYHEQHGQRALRFVTPGPRHRGEEVALLQPRRAVDEAAKARQPCRWSGAMPN